MHYAQRVALWRLLTECCRLIDSHRRARAKAAENQLRNVSRNNRLAGLWGSARQFCSHRRELRAVRSTLRAHLRPPLYLCRQDLGCFAQPGSLGGLKFCFVFAPLRSLIREGSLRGNEVHWSIHHAFVTPRTTRMFGVSSCLPHSSIVSCTNHSCRCVGGESPTHDIGYADQPASRLGDLLLLSDPKRPIRRARHSVFQSPTSPHGRRFRTDTGHARRTSDRGYLRQHPHQRQ